MTRPVTENPPGLTGHALASMWGTLRTEVVPDDVWTIGELGGVEVRLIDRGQDAIRRWSEMTVDEKMAHKIRLNSGHYPDLIARASPRSIEIVRHDDAWAIKFKASEQSMSWSDTKEPYRAHWNGKNWWMISDVVVEGDYEAFQLDASLMMLFSSQWMIDRPENDLWSKWGAMLKGGLGTYIGMGIGTGKTTIMSQQMIGRITRTAQQAMVQQPVVFFDYESDYIRPKYDTDSIYQEETQKLGKEEFNALLGINVLKEEVAEQRVLKVMKSRYTPSRDKSVTVYFDKKAPNIIVDDI